MRRGRRIGALWLLPLLLLALLAGALAWESSVLDARRSALDGELATMAAQVGRIPALRRALRARGRSVLPDRFLPDAWFLRLDQAARASGCALTSLNEGAAAATGAFTAVPLNVAVSGSLPGTVRFVERLARLPGVQVTAVTYGGGLAQVGLTVYVRDPP